MDIIDEIVAFLKARQEAEEQGKQEFTCPLCGATARWGRSSYNNHLHCSCQGCGFRMME